MQEYEVNAFLERLGLTEYEAKTLSALFKLREAEAPDISRNAQVPKTRVYDVLDRLTKRSLVIETHGRPKKYMCIEPSKVFGSLIEEKRKELNQLEKEAETLKQSIVTDKGDVQHEKVLKVKDRADFMRILGNEIDSASQSVKCLAPMGKEHTIIKEHLGRARARNVEIKLIGQINEASGKLAKEFTQAGISVRDFEHGMNAYIIDGKKVVLAISDFRQEKPEYHFTIWPDNKPMANALSRYFEHTWEQGKEI
ncbi:HTH-type sugar sensing transcriptional regulator TrmBL1 [uncultured archaeon]|nr:HTH-type sugar sensing transcriptional regulator TrmBL1 [uncultured archaeon]